MRVFSEGLPHPETASRPRTLHQLGWTLAAACAVFLPTFAHATDWPVVELPKEVRAFDVGQQVTLNGMPMRLRGFVTALAPKAAAAAFRQTLGKPLVENLLGDKLVLGRAQGEHYVVVQIERAGLGSRGVVALSHLKSADESVTVTEATTRRWLSRLPAGSTLLSQMESADGVKLSRHLVIANAQDETLNRDYLISLLADEGLALERESAPDRDAALRAPVGLADSRMLFFKGSRKEAIATLHHDSSGRTFVVLNLVTSVERIR